MEDLRWGGSRVLLACGGDAGEASSPGDREAESDPPSATEVDPELAAVVEARDAAERARAESVAEPGADPQLPALAETMTGVELERAVSDAEAELRASTAYRYGDRDRLVVQSVTLAEDRDDVAYVETCQVWDLDVVVLRTGAVPEELVTLGTVQASEELRREDGRWKLALSTANERTEGVGDCATEEEPSPATSGDPVDDSERQAVIAARKRAEQSWIAALVDPSLPAPTESYTAELLDWFTGGENGIDSMPGVALRRDCIPVWDDATNTGTSERSCRDRVWAGRAGGTFLLRSDGIAMAPSSTSTVTVESVSFPPTDSPTVAYLRTCRTYNLTRADGQPLDIPATATVRATETMRQEGGTWKVAATWGYEVGLGASQC